MKKIWFVCVLLVWGCTEDGANDSNTPTPDARTPNFILADEGVESDATDLVSSLVDGGVMDGDGSVSNEMPQSEYGGPCRSNSDCLSGFCIASPLGFLCSQLCAQNADCPDVAGPMTCNFVENFGADRIRICTPDEGSLCQPCFRDDHCFGGRCIINPQGNVCSIACDENSECPSGSECQNENESGEQFETPQCVPDLSLCDCTDDQAGETRTCVRTADGFDGRCFGEETCDPSVGWSGCNAPAPVEEVCDGLDNDCNGAIDDGLGIGEVCTNENAFGRCPGTRLCNGAEGWSCLGPEPSTERCDPVDNDCDGQNDEDYLNEDGLYLTPEHCGSCNVDCAGFYPLATATDCALIDGTPQCIITACRAGFVLAAPTLCVPLATQLCDPCERDVDCNDELGDRCIEYPGNSRFCGRSCGPESPFGDECPLGFSCDDSGQCRLDEGSCLCSANDNFILPCTVTSPTDPEQRCVGTQVCANGDLGRCELPTEVCDTFDDDCDGAVDEDFVDPIDNQYTDDAHCGRCNNDCVARLSGAEVNGVGYCDVTDENPACGIRCNDGFSDINGILADGCECQILDANADEPDIQGVDANCDGIDGEVIRGVFVAPTGDDTADGTRGSPLRTIQVGIERAGEGRDHVYVAAGVYAEAITLRTGISVFGGYSADFARRDLNGNETAIFPPIEVEGERLGTVTGIEIAGVPTRMSGFTIVGHAESIPSRSSYAVYLRDSDDNLALEHNQIRAGSGGGGLRGQSGTPGTDAPDNATTGETESSSRPDRCEENGDNLNEGGQGGRHECAVVGGDNIITHGGNGGSSDCPIFNQPEGAGESGEGPDNGGDGGAGGYNQQLVSAQIGCACLVPGTPGATEVGISGASGGAGISGSGGSGCGEGSGRIIDGQWVAGTADGPERNGGGDGQGGGPGGGGGGGGAGSGVQYGNSRDCNNFGSEVLGGGGGGGGAGGCGGTGGTGGTSGGGAFGVFIFFTQPANSSPILRGNVIERGFGGAGGDGGEGGEGGSGALGKPASALSGDDRDGLLACADPGGRGGDGGPGGDGAGGGGGCGGLSAGIYLGGLEVENPMEGLGENIFPQTGAPGVGGRGGLSLTNGGEDGADGQYVEVAR